MKEIVVLSGKGGTGKTSLVACFASLAKNAVLADCDVDAADLYLVLEPKISRTEGFIGGVRAKIVPDKCSACGLCMELCRFDAIIEKKVEDIPELTTYTVDELACEGCGVCAYFCPEQAIDLEHPECGKVYVSDMRYGPMVYAKLGIAQENSGKLVAQVRKYSRNIANDKSADYIIVDGPPGVGCPVISSLTGADMVMVVTEPTISGLSDLQRVVQLAHHFDIKACICINKWDINPEVTEEIIRYAEKQKMKVLGKIDYNNVFTKAQIAKATVIEFSNGTIVNQIKMVWQNLVNELK